MTVSLAPTDQELAAIRADFPILGRRLITPAEEAFYQPSAPEGGGAKLVYLDSGATAQRPRVVLDAMRDFSENHNAAVHRGAHALASEATEAFEGARESIAAFVGAEAGELVFTSGATGAINLLTAALGAASTGRGQGLGRRFAILPGDRIVVTQAEHHSNLVPWQELAARTGAELAWLRVGADGRLRLDDLEGVINPRTRVMAFTHASNVTGAISDVAAITAAARRVGAFTVLDAAQTVPHQPVDLPALGVDFAAFSAHKMLGPNGIGGLYGRAELLEALPPGFTGGSMVEIVTMRDATFLPPPHRFEAGTQAVTQAIGWAAAVGYLSHLGMERIAAHEHELTVRLLDALATLEGVRVLGPAEAQDRLGAVAVDVAGVHAHDVGQYLDAQGIAIRVGHHCAQPIHRALGVQASTRASLALYNTADEIDRFVAALGEVRGYFGAAG
ncbi:MAG: SufS family cysteine desulfurase [Bifidobacteriaceae bacterium]|jgi:cysteine desulfurase/selenocysteine lyase|nr:SufS family cysteine desulfurase [Bifidobacteriaceae bacterium]